MFLNIGPQHPSTHGVLRVVLKIDGEQVVDLDPVLGYLHRGVEKICENADCHHVISHCDPLEYIASHVQRVRAGAGLREAARRAGAAPRRVHPGPRLRAQPDLQPRPVHGLAGAGPGRPHADPVRLHRARRDRRDARRADRPAAALQLLAHRRRQRRPEPRVHEPPGRLDEPRRRAASRTSTTLLNENEIFVGRDARPGRPRPRDRAADVRHRAATCAPRACPTTSAGRIPTRVYPELEFDIPTRDGGRLATPATCSASTRSSRASGSSTRCSTSMPDGPVMAKLPRLLRPRPGRAWAAVESPRGQYGAYAISDGTDQPFRLRIHDPSFLHLQAVGLLMPGQPRSRTRWPSWPASTRSWAASTSDAIVVAAVGERLHRRRGRASCCRSRRRGRSASALVFAGRAVERHPARAWSEPRSCDVLGANVRIVRFVVAATAVLLFTVPTAFMIIYMEMKVIALHEPARRPQPGRARGARSRRWSTASRCWPRRTSPRPARTCRCSPWRRWSSTWPR